MTARTDVEALFLTDMLPPQVPMAIYDDWGGNRRHIAVALRHRDIFEVQDRVVELIVQTGRRKPLMRPFILMRAFEMMHNWDLALDALLVNPEFVPLLEKVQGPIWGRRLKLFEHMDVPPGEIFGLPGPEYLGVIPRQGEGVGVSLLNRICIIRGEFPRAGAVRRQARTLRPVPPIPEFELTRR